MARTNASKEAPIKKELSEMSAEELMAEALELKSTVEDQAQEIQRLKESVERLSAPDANRRRFTFKDGEEETEYEVVPAKLKWQDKIVTAEEIITNEDLHRELLQFAWEGRTEATFNKNGIFKIIY